MADEVVQLICRCLTSCMLYFKCFAIVSLVMKKKSLKCFIFVVDKWIVYIVYITTLHSSKICIIYLLYSYDFIL